MDRRQKKTRANIFKAFVELLGKKRYDKITVGEIIEAADVGRATFYAHFETKDFLLKDLCEELFCHVFDTSGQGDENHKHIFSCDEKCSIVLHLLRHLKNNDNNILKLLSSENNEQFSSYFKKDLIELIKKQPLSFPKKKDENIPDEFWINHIAATFVETVRWWIAIEMKASPEAIADYFERALA